MKTLTAVFTICMLISSLDIYSQNVWRMDSLFLFRSIPLDAQSVYSDAKNQIYILTNKNEVILINPIGEIINTYSNNYLGKPQFIYIQNPLQVILFYPDFQTLVFLDKSLNELNKIKLNSYPIPRVNTIGYSPDKSIWYFDDATGRVKKMNQQRAIEVDVMVPELQNGNRIIQILAQKNEILILENQGKVYRIDLFGKLISTNQIKGDLLDWSDSILLFVDIGEQKINRMDDNQFDQYSLPDPLTGMRSVAIILSGIVGINDKGDVSIFHYQ